MFLLQHLRLSSYMQAHHRESEGYVPVLLTRSVYVVCFLNTFSFIEGSRMKEINGGKNKQRNAQMQLVVSR